MRRLMCALVVGAMLVVPASAQAFGGFGRQRVVVRSPRANVVVSRGFGRQQVFVNTGRANVVVGGFHSQAFVQPVFVPRQQVFVQPQFFHPVQQFQGFCPFTGQAIFR